MRDSGPTTAFRGLLVILILPALLAVAGCRKKEPPPKPEVVRPVKIMTVKKVRTEVSHSLPGMVRAARRAELSFKVSGPLVALPVEEGQHVKKGDLIAQIQKRDFINSLKEARARFLEADKQFRRYKDLYAKKQVSRADFDRYRAARDVAAAKLEDASNALADTTLVAPFDGIVSKRFVENFQKVQAKQPIVNLQDISQVEILINVPELLMAGLRAHHPKEIFATFESIPGKKFPLTVKEYSTQADPATQTYQVVLLMDQPSEATILPGMTAQVTSLSGGDDKGGESMILIPAIAVMDAPGDHPYVWLFDAKTSTVRKQPVAIGPIEGSANILVREGLQGGETIVVAGLTQLREGMKVRPWEKQREYK